MPVSRQLFSLPYPTRPVFGRGGLTPARFLPYCAAHLPCSQHIETALRQLWRGTPSTVLNQAYGERAAMRGYAARRGFTLCDGKVGLRFRSGNKVIRACRTAVLARMLALILRAACLRAKQQNPWTHGRSQRPQVMWLGGRTASNGWVQRYSISI